MHLTNLTSSTPTLSTHPFTLLDFARIPNFSKNTRLLYKVYKEFDLLKLFVIVITLLFFQMWLNVTFYTWMLFKKLIFPIFYFVIWFFINQIDMERYYNNMFQQSAASRRKSTAIERLTDPETVTNYLCGYSLRICTLYLLWIHLVSIL